MLRQLGVWKVGQQSLVTLINESVPKREDDCSVTSYLNQRIGSKKGSGLLQSLVTLINESDPKREADCSLVTSYLNQLITGQPPINSLLINFLLSPCHGRVKNLLRYHIMIFLPSLIMQDTYKITAVLPYNDIIMIFLPRLIIYASYHSCISSFVHVSLSENCLPTRP